jgi:hypothetical protein
MSKLPWYFVWSDNYGVFADILTSIISDNFFDLCPIEIPQEEFDRTLYQEGKYFLTGMYIKDYEIHKILQNTKEDSYFIFSDVDVIAFEDELHDYLVPFLENKDNNDIVFYKENETNINVCFMLIKNTKKVRELYESIIEHHKIHNDYCDGGLMNEMLKTWDGKYSTFSPDYVASTINMKISEHNYKNICVFAASCTAFNNYKLNNIEKLLSFQNLFNMDLTEYIDSIKNELDEKDLKIVKRIIEHYPAKNE